MASDGAPDALIGFVSRSNKETSETTTLYIVM